MNSIYLHKCYRFEFHFHILCRFYPNFIRVYPDPGFFQKANETHSGYYPECVSSVFLKNQRHHNFFRDLLTFRHLQLVVTGQWPSLVVGLTLFLLGKSGWNSSSSLAKASLLSLLLCMSMSTGHVRPFWFSPRLRQVRSCQGLEI